MAASQAWRRMGARLFCRGTMQTLKFVGVAVLGGGAAAAASGEEAGPAWRAHLLPDISKLWPVAAAQTQGSSSSVPGSRSAEDYAPGQHSGSAGGSLAGAAGTAAVAAVAGAVVEGRKEGKHGGAGEVLQSLDS